MKSFGFHKLERKKRNKLRSFPFEQPHVFVCTLDEAPVIHPRLPFDRLEEAEEDRRHHHLAQSALIMGPRISHTPYGSFPLSPRPTNGHPRSKDEATDVVGPRL